MPDLPIVDHLLPRIDPGDHDVKDRRSLDGPRDIAQVSVRNLSADIVADQGYALQAGGLDRCFNITRKCALIRAAGPTRTDLPTPGRSTATTLKVA